MSDERRPQKVVTCFLRRRDPQGKEQILILRRSGRVGTYRGRWAGVSGYLEEDDPTAQAVTEIREETGLTADDVALVRAGDPLPVEDVESGLSWLVHPFLFDMRSDKELELDWESVEARWIAPEELSAYDTVPALGETLNRVYRAPGRR
jgi:8-oxo-dGTP pyrophosphatase MutT (NUDIX family)